MPDKVDIEYFRNKGFRAWQADFAIDFLSDNEKPYWALVSPTGSGKTRLAAGLIAYELENKAAKHILVVTRSKVFLQDWKAAMLSYGEPFTNTENIPLIIDSKIFYELDANTPEDKSPWQNQKIVIMSIDLIRHKSLISSLVTIKWDFAVFDDCMDSPDIVHLFNNLVDSNSVVSSLFLSNKEIHDEKLTNKLVKKVNISLDSLLRLNKKPAFTYDIGYINYQMTQEERVFFNSIKSFAGELRKTWAYGEMQEKIVLRIACSSLYAAEQMLKRFQTNWTFLRNKIAHSIGFSLEDSEKAQENLKFFADELRSSYKFSTTKIHVKRFLHLYANLESLITNIEKLSRDSKIEALTKYLKDNAGGAGKCYICIITSFADTVHYIYSSLMDLGLPVYSMTSSSTSAERLGLVEVFHRTGGILILTQACCEGIEFENVEKLINYDETPDSRAFELVLTRFSMFGGNKKLFILNLKQESPASEAGSDG